MRASLADRMRVNAELLDAMLDNQVRLDRHALDGLVADIREWAAEVAAIPQSKPEARAVARTR